jgi:transposase-like protein
MGMEPYKDKNYLYEMYVKKRMNLTDICKHLKNTYSIEVTPQAVYNWVKKYDLLKYRGKGRNLSQTSMRRPKSPMQKEVEKKRNEMKKLNQAKKKGKRF